MTPSTVRYHQQKAARRDAGLCHIPRCPHPARPGRVDCEHCSMIQRRRDTRRADAFEARGIGRGIRPEWEAKRAENLNAIAVKILQGQEQL